VLLLVLGVGFFGILPRFEKLNSLIAGLEDKLRSEMAQIGNLGQKGEKSWWEADDTEEGKTYLVLRLEDGTLVRAEVVEGEVTDEKLTADSVVRMEGGETVVLKSNIGEGDITEWHLASGSVEKAEIKNGVVTTKKLANGSVTNVKIARGTITGSRIKNYTVAGEDIASDGSVVKSIAGDGAVTATNNNDGSYSLVLKPTCSNNQILKWNETAGEWECAEDGGGGSSGGGIPLDANFGGDVSGTYGAIAVTDDSHTHTSATLPAATSYLGSTIETGEITNDTILEVDLSTSNAPAAGQVLTYNAGTGGFTWANDAGGISYTAGAGLDLTVAEFSTDLLSTGGLQVSGADNELGIKLDGATLALGAGGLKIADTYDDNFLTTSTGLQLTGGTLTGTLTLNDNDGASNDVNLNIGDANETGQIVFYDGSANTGTLSQDSIGADAVYTLTGATGYLLTSANYTSYLAHDSITGAGTVDTTAEVQAVAVGGDLSGTVGNIAVTDDSHNHTTTTISGLDISSDTNLIGGSHLTLNDDTMDVDDDFVLNTGDTITGTLIVNDNDGASNDVNITLGDANETGQIVFYDGSANTGTLSQDSIGADAVYTLTGATGYLLTSANYTSYLAHDSITGAGTVDTTAEVQAVAVGGDLSGTVGNAAVGDDSHAHTTTTISGLDISADTNLSGDTEIVLTDDALSIASSITRDSELSAYALLTGGTFSGTVTLNDNDGASNDVNLNIGDANETGQIVFYDGSANTGTLSQDSIGADAVYTLTGATGYLLTSANYTSYLAHDSITGAGTVDTTAEVQAVAVGGDLSGTVGNAAVGDDSHAHTTTTISGLDISADTNVSGDTEIVLTDDALSIASSITRDSELAAYLQLAGGTMTGNLTIQKADPTLVLDTLTATDTDFWLGVTEDAGGDDDDKFQIGDGTTPGTNPFLTIDTSGQVGIGTVSPGGMVEIDTGTSSGIALLIDQDDTDATALDFDINNVSGDILNMDWGGATTLTAALQAIDIDFTNVTADGTNAAYGLHVNDFSALTASAEYGVYVQGTNFDYSVVTEGDILLNNAGAELTIMDSDSSHYGTLEIGDLAANATYTFSGVSGTVVTTTTEAVFTGSARHSRRIQLNAEYAGAVVSTFYGSGTDASITGNMTSDAEPSADLLRTYYEWNSSEASLNYYTVAVRVTLPQDFDAWATSNAVQVDLDTETTDAANNVLGVYIYNGDDTPGSAVATSTGNKSSVADTWTTVTIDDSVIDDGAAPDWDAAGETAVIYLRLGSKSDNFARVGDIKLNYLSKW